MYVSLNDHFIFDLQETVMDRKALEYLNVANVNAI